MKKFIFMTVVINIFFDVLLSCFMVLLQISKLVYIDVFSGHNPKPK